jgi:hypothetical protein
MVLHRPTGTCKGQITALWRCLSASNSSAKRSSKRVVFAVRNVVHVSRFVGRMHCIMGGSWRCTLGMRWPLSSLSASVRVLILSAHVT